MDAPLPLYVHMYVPGQTQVGRQYSQTEVKINGCFWEGIRYSLVGHIWAATTS